MKGNLDKVLKHVVSMEYEYRGWDRDLPPELETITLMVLIVQEKIDEFADANLRG